MTRLPSRRLCILRLGSSVLKFRTAPEMNGFSHRHRVWRRGMRVFGELLRQFSTHEKRPNKAPEPTTMAVTPRAIVRVIEMKPQNLNRNAARGAPAMVVAHL